MSGETEYAYVVAGKMALPYQYFAGAVGSKFLIALRDEKRILGVRCPKCATTFVPPRQTCERCFSDLTSHWVDVGSSGEITGYTVINYREPYQPKEPPYVLALIKLDGADTPFAHILNCADGSKPAIGMRVRAVFSQEPKDNILAISHFELEA